MNMLEAMQTRHSVRQYTDQAIEPEKRQMLEQLIQDINEDAGLHIQIFFDEPDCFNRTKNRYACSLWAMAKPMALPTKTSR